MNKSNSLPENLNFFPRLCERQSFLFCDDLIEKAQQMHKTELLTNRLCADLDRVSLQMKKYKDIQQPPLIALNTLVQPNNLSKNDITGKILNGLNLLMFSQFLINSSPDNIKKLIKLCQSQDKFCAELLEKARNRQVTSGQDIFVVREGMLFKQSSLFGAFS